MLWWCYALLGCFDCCMIICSQYTVLFSFTFKVVNKRRSLKSSDFWSPLSWLTRCLLGNWPLFTNNLWSFRIFFYCSISNKLWPPLKGRSKFQCQSLMPSSGWVTYLFFRLRSSASSLYWYNFLFSVVDSHIFFWDCHHVVSHLSGIRQALVRHSLELELLAHPCRQKGFSVLFFSVFFARKL